MKKSGLCGRCGTRAVGTSGYCAPCHAEKTREYRKTHSVSEEQRLKGIARSYLNVNIRRGKVKRLPCEECGTSPAQGHHYAGYDHPLVVRWLCRHHHRLAHRQEATQAA